jgi:hypothetical protein
MVVVFAGMVVVFAGMVVVLDPPLTMTVPVMPNAQWGIQ